MAIRATDLTFVEFFFYPSPGNISADHLADILRFSPADMVKLYYANWMAI